MRPRFTISILVLTVALLAVIFWLRPKHHASLPPEVQESVQRTNSSFRSTASGSSQNLPHASPTPAASQQSIVTHKVETPEEARQRIESANVPVDFWGKFIDQDNNALAGVDIKVIVRHWTMPDPTVPFAGSEDIPLEQKSGPDGLFELKGATGDVFDIISIQRLGYELSPKAGHTFGAIGGSFENPVIFKMWKLGEKAQLISGSKFWGIVPDGRTYTIDFVRGEKIESNDAQGDVRISVVRPAQIQPRIKFDWSFSIGAVNGGLIQTTDDFMYLAPESDYQPSYQFTMSSTNADWKSELDGLQFYLKSRDGQVYGRFVFDIIPRYNNVSVFNVNWTINPTGSRNLQP